MWHFFLTILTFFSRNCEFTSHNSDRIARYRRAVIKSVLRNINSQLQEKNSELRNLNFKFAILTFSEFSLNLVFFLAIVSLYHAIVTLWAYLHLDTSCIISDRISIRFVKTFSFTLGHINVSEFTSKKAIDMRSILFIISWFQYQTATGESTTSALER